MMCAPQFDCGCPRAELSDLPSANDSVTNVARRPCARTARAWNQHRLLGGSALLARSSVLGPLRIGQLCLDAKPLSVIMGCGEALVELVDLLPTPFEFLTAGSNHRLLGTKFLHQRSLAGCRLLRRSRA